jgi:hypothetical protein
MELHPRDWKIPTSSISKCKDFHFFPSASSVFFCVFWLLKVKMWNTRLLLVLALLAAPSALAWNHADDAAALKEALETNDFTLVACKLPDTPKSHKLQANNDLVVHPTEYYTLPIKPHLTKTLTPCHSPQTPALEPEWTTLQSKDPSHITSIDCSLPDFTALCASLAVHSFPAIRLYHGSNNHFTRYRGPRRHTPILSFLRRTLRPPLQTVTPFNTTSFLSSDAILFIAHFPPETKPSLRQKYEKIAHKYRDRYSFAVHSDVQGINTGDGTAKIECFNIPDELQRSITEGLDSEKVLEGFVRVCGGSLIPELTRRNEIGFYNVSFFFHSPFFCLFL